MSHSRGVLVAAVTSFALALAVVWLIFSPRPVSDLLAMCVAGVFAVCVSLGLAEPTPLNPYLLFALTPLSLLAYDAAVSNWYLVSLGTDTWAIAVINMMMFVVGLRVFQRRSPRSAPAVAVVDDALQRHALTLLAISLVPTVYGMIIGLPDLLAGDLLAMSTHTVALPLASTIMLAKYPAIAFAVKSRKKWLILFTLALSVGALMLHFNKSEFGLLVMTVLVVSYKYHGHRSQRRWLINVALVGALLAGVFLVAVFDAARSDFDSTGNVVLKGGSWVHEDALLLPYMYFASPWTNLDYVLRTQPNHTYGLWAAKPVLGYLGADKLFEAQYELRPYSSFNTYTFVAVQFKDFGFLGSGLISLALGAFVAVIYRMHLASDSPLVTAVYALNAVAVAEMFFSNHFFSVGYPLSIILLSWLYYAVFLRGSAGVMRAASAS